MSRGRNNPLLMTVIGNPGGRCNKHRVVGRVRMNSPLLSAMAGGATAAVVGRAISRNPRRKRTRASRYARRTARGRPSRARYVRERVAPKSRFDPRSFRTVRSGRHRVVIGCPTGKWDARRRRCRVGTRAQSVLHPTKKNPRRRRKPGKFSVGRGPTERKLTPRQARRIIDNPGRRRKVTMTIQQFARHIQKSGDRDLMKDFKKKIRDYQRWTHGSLPRRVTVERVDAPGVKGVWLTTDLGKEPESRYVMPGGSRRKGAWKHRWEAMPSLKGDAKAGVIITKLRSSNKISDFLHG